MDPLVLKTTHELDILYTGLLMEWMPTYLKHTMVKITILIKIETLKNLPNIFL